MYHIAVPKPNMSGVDYIHMPLYHQTDHLCTCKIHGFRQHQHLAAGKVKGRPRTRLVPHNRTNYNGRMRDCRTHTQITNSRFGQPANLSVSGAGSTSLP